LPFAEFASGSRCVGATNLLISTRSPPSHTTPADPLDATRQASITPRACPKPAATAAPHHLHHDSSSRRDHGSQRRHTSNLRKRRLGVHDPGVDGTPSLGRSAYPTRRPKRRTGSVRR